VNKRSFKRIPNPCRYCLYWQTSGDFGEEMLGPEMEKKKLEWFNKVIKEFGSCIRLAYSSGIPVGFAQFAQTKFFPQVKDYTSGPPSGDAVFIACLYITDKDSRGKGIGTAMLDDLVVELQKRGIKAVETFARRSSENNPSGPLELYLKRGFRIVRGEKDDFPLMRREL
jgi:GNAT superfamily N-acetyltransferase